MTRRIRSVALAAVAFGVAAAVVVALLVPERSSGERAGSAHRHIVVLQREPVKLDPGFVQLVPEPGSVRIDARLPDPRGGPPFALRVFRAKRLALYASHPSLDHARVLGHELCAQLGRIYRGKFGWLDARDRFRPAQIGYRDTPVVCGDRWRDARSAPQIRLTTLISDPARESAKPLQSVAWGFGGPLARRVTLTGVDDTTPKLSSRGAFLVHADSQSRANELRARFEYRGRPDVELSFQPTPGALPPSHFRDLARPIPGSGGIEARAPDPGGSVAWGVLGYRTNKGGFCVTQPGRIVGDRVGTIDFRLDTFVDVWDYGRVCGASTDRLPPDWPVGIGSMFGGGLTPQSADPTSDPEAGRTALRTLPGRTVVYGVAKREVRALTIESPRDVRTLLPSPRARTFIVVYDGAFPTGNFTLTATMADGSKKTVRQPAGL